MFQFQYGTIKSEYKKAYLSDNALFQFQYGTIKSIVRALGDATVYAVSIPIWYN